MALVTALTMITRSLRMVGFKAIGQTLSTAEQTDYLSDLNSMLDSWGINTGMCSQLLDESFSLTSGIGNYTIGPGGVFDTARPNDIVDPCFVRQNSDSSDSPIEIIDAVRYGQITLKSISGTDPTHLFYDQVLIGSDKSTVRLYPLPGSGLTLHIASWKPVQKFADINAPIQMPPGYQLAIESNFAIHAAAGIRQVSSETAKIARDSKADIMRKNSRTGVMQMPAGLVSGIRTSILAGR